MRIPRLHFSNLPGPGLPGPGPGHSVTLNEERTHYLSRVLRLRPGDELRVFDGCGHEYVASIVGGPRTGWVVKLLKEHQPIPESPLRLALFQGLCRGARMDLVLQKATELGVSSITPVSCKRSNVVLKGERLEKRMRHWQGVITSACEQSGRAWLPQLHPLLSLDELQVSDDCQALFLDSRADNRLGDYQPNGTRLGLLIGPEGGLSESEQKLLLNRGFSGLSLGPRILRTETAGLAAIAVLQSRFGDC